MAVGRPSIYTEGLADRICRRLSEGESLNRICQDAEMPGSTTVFRWLGENQAFRDKYARARETQMDAMAEEILEIADLGDPEQANWLKLRVDTRKWLMSKIAPKKYGDRTVLAGDDTAPLSIAVVHVAKSED